MPTLIFFYINNYNEQKITTHYFQKGICLFVMQGMCVSPEWQSRRPINYRERYSPTAMTNAFRAVKDDKMSAYKASRHFGVPETTIRDRIKGRINVVKN